MADPANNVNFRARRHSLGCVEERRSQPIGGGFGRRLSDTNLAVRAAPAEQMQTTQCARTEGAMTSPAPSPSELDQNLRGLIGRIDLQLENMEALGQRLLVNLRPLSVPIAQEMQSQSLTPREQATSPISYNLRDLFNYSPLSRSPSPVAEDITSCNVFQPIAPAVPSPSGSPVILHRPIVQSSLSSQTDSTPTPADERPAITWPRFSPFSSFSLFSSRSSSPLSGDERAEEGASAARSSTSPLRPSDFIPAADDDDPFFFAPRVTAIDDDTSSAFSGPLIAVPATVIDDDDTGDVNDIGSSSRLPVDGAQAHSERAERVISPYRAPIITQRSDSIDSLSSADLFLMAGTLVSHSGDGADADDLGVASSSAAGTQSSRSSPGWISAAVTYQPPEEETTQQPLQHTARRASSPDADVGDLTVATRAYSPQSSSAQTAATHASAAYQVRPTIEFDLMDDSSDDESFAEGAARVSIPLGTGTGAPFSSLQLHSQQSPHSQPPRPIQQQRSQLQFRAATTQVTQALPQPLSSAGAPRLSLPAGIPSSAISLVRPTGPISQAQSSQLTAEELDLQLALALHQAELSRQFRPRQPPVNQSQAGQHQRWNPIGYEDSDDEGGG